MFTFLDSFVNYSVNSGFVSHDEAPFLRYNLEKLLSNLFLSIPFVIIGCFLTSLETGITFFVAFSFLRVRTNGYHSKTFWRCLFTSVALEIVFLVLFYHWLSYTALLIALALSAITIFFLAPFRHPNMNYSDEEVRVCSKSSKIRIMILLLGAVLLFQTGCWELAKGIVLGITMTAFLLVLAYITRRNHYEKEAN